VAELEGLENSWAAQVGEPPPPAAAAAPLQLPCLACCSALPQATQPGCTLHRLPSPELRTSLLDASDPARWLASVYFATTTMTTVG
jgi:hypothetical protein